MEEGTYEMHSVSEDDKVFLEKNAKRVLKTCVQVEALENLYNEEKNPSMATKKELADSIGLSEKQVNGWFCHRRLKDKRIMNGEIRSTGMQDRSSVVIQDHASGHKQDSCGSSKLGEGKNFDAKEVEIESGRIIQQKQIYEQGGDNARNNNRTNAASSGNSSSSDDQIDEKNLRYSTLPKISSDMKSIKVRTGPSGYLKVKGQPVENPAITAVKRQLRRHYREDGPPLSIEFDLLPPVAFESTMQDPVDETYLNEDDLPTPPDVPKAHQLNFSQGYDYNSDVASHSRNMHGKRFKSAKMSEDPYSYFGPNSSEYNPLAYNSTYYPRKNPFVEFPEGSARDARGSDGGDDYGMLPKQNFEREGVLSKHREPELHGKNVRAERKPYNKYNYPANNISTGEIVERSSYYAVKGYEHSKSLEPELPQHIVKTPKRTMHDSPHQHPKRASVVDNRSGNFQVVRRSAEMLSNISKDDESTETLQRIEIKKGQG